MEEELVAFWTTRCKELAAALASLPDSQYVAWVRFLLICIEESHDGGWRQDGESMQIFLDAADDRVNAPPNGRVWDQVPQAAVAPSEEE